MASLGRQDRPRGPGTARVLTGRTLASGSRLARTQVPWAAGGRTCKDSMLWDPLTALRVLAEPGAVHLWNPAPPAWPGPAPPTPPWRPVPAALRGPGRPGGTALGRVHLPGSPTAQSGADAVARMVDRPDGERPFAASPGEPGYLRSKMTTFWCVTGGAHAGSTSGTRSQAGRYHDELPAAQATSAAPSPVNVP